MWKKIAVAAATTAAVAGAGTAALAATSTSGSTNAPAPAATGTAAPGAPASGAAHGQGAAGRKHRPLQRLKNFEHGTWVTAGAGGTTVTHTAIHGTVGAVSATSITVTAADRTSLTFVVNGDTKVHTRAQHKGAPISAVKSGDSVVVTGTGTGPVTAKQIVDGAK